MQRPPSQTLLRGGALLTSPSVSRSGAAASSSPASASSGAAPVTVSAGAALSATPGPPAPQHWDATATVTAVALAIDGLANEESVESDGDSSASGSPALPHRVLDAPQQATVFGPGMSGQRARRGAGSTATPTSQREGSETEDARPMARFRSTSKPPAGGNNNGVVDSSLLPPPAVGFAQQSPQLPPSPQRGVSQSRPRAGSSAAAPPVVAVGPSRGWARMGGLMRQGKLRRDEADGRARTSSIDERTREDMAMGGVVAPIPPSGGGGGLLSRLLGGGAPPAPQRTDSGRLMASSGEAAPKFLGSGLLASLVSSTRKQHKGASVWMAAATNMAKRDKSDLASVAYRPRATDEQLQQLKPKVPPSDEDYEVAAAYVLAGQRGVPFPRQTDRLSLRLFRFTQNSAAQYILYALQVAHIILAAFESPAVNGLTMPYPASDVIDIVLTSVFAMWVLALVRLDGLRAHLRKGWNIVRLAAIITAIVAAAVTFAVDEVRTASQLCRPVMLVSLSPQLRSATVQIMRALRATALPLLLLIFMVLFYALLGMVIFARTPEGDKFFPNLLRAVVSIHVLFTTCNNPDVRIPAYTNDIASALFFMSFSFIGMMFVYNLMTGFVATSYRTGAKEGMQETFELQTAAYYLAFCRLDREHRGVVDVSTIHHMLRVYSRRGDEIPLAVLAAMPTAQMGLFDLWEFQDLCDLLVFRIFKLRSPPVLARCAPRFFHGLRTVAKHRAFTVAVYVLIVSSSLVAVVHTSIVVGTLPASGTRAFLSDGRAATRTFAVIIDEWFWVHTAFMVAAVAEILVRVGGMGIRQTFSEMWFVVDLLVQMISVAAWITYAASSETFRASTSMWVFYQIAVITRTMRFVFAIEPVRLLGGVILQVMPVLRTFLVLIGLFLYTASVVGVAAFSSKITSTTPGIATSDYGVLGYYQSSFDDVVRGVFLAWDLLVVNNWMVYMEAYSIATSEWARVFFVSFWFLSDIVFMNLLVAFFLEVFAARLRLEALDKQARERALKAAKYYRMLVSIEGTRLVELRDVRDSALSGTASKSDAVGYLSLTLSFAAVTALDAVLNPSNLFNQDAMAVSYKDDFDGDVAKLASSSAKAKSERELRTAGTSSKLTQPSASRMTLAQAASTNSIHTGSTNVLGGGRAAPTLALPGTPLAGRAAVMSAPVATTALGPPAAPQNASASLAVPTLRVVPGSTVVRSPRSAAAAAAAAGAGASAHPPHHPVFVSKRARLAAREAILKYARDVNTKEKAAREQEAALKLSAVPKVSGVPSPQSSPRLTGRRSPVGTATVGSFALPRGGNTSPHPSPRRVGTRIGARALAPRDSAGVLEVGHAPASAGATLGAPAAAASGSSRNLAPGSSGSSSSGRAAGSAESPVEVAPNAENDDDNDDSEDGSDDVVSRPQEMYFPINKLYKMGYGLERSNNYVQMQMTMFADQLAPVSRARLDEVIADINIDWYEREAFQDEGDDGDV